MTQALLNFIALYSIVSILIMIATRCWQLETNYDDSKLDYSLSRCIIVFLVAPIMLVNFLMEEVL